MKRTWGDVAGHTVAGAVVGGIVGGGTCIITLHWMAIKGYMVGGAVVGAFVGVVGGEQGITEMWSDFAGQDVDATIQKASDNLHAQNTSNTQREVRRQWQLQRDSQWQQQQFYQRLNNNINL